MAYPKINLSRDYLFGGKPKKKRKGFSRKMIYEKLMDSQKCQRCKKPMKGLTPHKHHKDGNRSNNKPSNMMIICPNCHDKLHKKMEPLKKKSKTKKQPNSFGIFSIKTPKVSVPRFKF